jgi:hypothetical protein
MSEREPTEYKPKKKDVNKYPLVTTVLNKSIVILGIKGFSTFEWKGKQAEVCEFETDHGILKTGGVALLKQLKEMQEMGKFPYKVTPHIAEGKRYQTF